MKVKIRLLIVLLVILSRTSIAQLKINEYGRIGIGIEPSPYYKFLIKGDLVLTTYPEIPPPLSSPTELRFKVGNGNPGTEIGTPTRKIAFWSSEVGFNTLYAQHYYTISDTSEKTDIQPIHDGLNRILQINSYSFKYKYDTIVDSIRTFGFLAHEVQSILPNITDTIKRLRLIEYQQIIPLLVEAVKEQQALIDSLENHINQRRLISLDKTDNDDPTTLESLKKEIVELKNQMSLCCNQHKPLNTEMNKAEKNSSSKLYQNKPNPFTANTIIEFEIEQSSNNASIMIFDMQGTLKKVIL